MVVMTRRRPTRVRREHHVGDRVYWSKVSARHARNAVRHAERAERYATRSRNASVAAAALMLALVVYLLVRALG